MRVCCCQETNLAAPTKHSERAQNRLCFQFRPDAHLLGLRTLSSSDLAIPIKLSRSSLAQTQSIYSCLTSIHQSNPPDSYFQHCSLTYKQPQTVSAHRAKAR